MVFQYYFFYVFKGYIFILNCINNEKVYKENWEESGGVLLLDQKQKYLKFFIGKIWQDYFFKGF